MPLQKQSMPVPLGALDTKTDPKTTPVGQMLVVENAWRKRTGEYRKRPGNAEVEYPPGSLRLLAALNGRPLFFGDSSCTTPTASGDFEPQLKAKDRATAVTQSNVEMFRFERLTDYGFASRATGDAADNGTYVVYGFSHNDRAKILCIDKATDTVIDLQEPDGNVVSDATKVRVQAVGNVFFILYVQNFRILLKSYDAQTGAVATVLDALALTNAQGDLRAFGSNFHLVYSTGTTLTGVVYNTAGVQQSTGNFTVGTTPSWISTDLSVTWWHVAYGQLGGRQTLHRALNLSFSSTTIVEDTAILAPTGFTSLQCSILASADQCSIYGSYIDDTAEENADVFFSHRTGGGGFSVINRTLGFGYVLASRPVLSTTPGQQFIVLQRDRSWDAGKNRHFVLICHDRTYSGADFAQFNGISRFAANLADRAGWNLQSVNFTDSNGQARTGGLFYAAGVIAQIASINTTSAIGLATTLARWYFYRNDAITSVQIENDLYFSGPSIMHWDSQQVSELSFLHAPGFYKHTVIGSGGGIAAGDYRYAMLFKWVDANGSIHRSEPTFLDVTFGLSSSQLVVQIYGLPTTMKTRVSVEFYRSLVNAQAVLYYLATVENSDSFSAGIEIFTDTVADSAIQSNTTLYTSAGVLPFLMPAGGNAVATKNGRLYITDSELPNRVFYTNEKNATFGLASPGGISIEGSTVGGPYRALVALDDRMVLFKARGSHWFTGRGPTDTGADSDFSPIVDLPFNVGTVRPRSVVVVPQGVMFQSERGIRLLDRSLNESYVGAPVERFNAQIVTQTIVSPDEDLVRFYTFGGNTLVFSTLYNEWYVWTPQPTTSACLYGSTALALQATSLAAWRETPAAFTDPLLPGGVPIITRYVLALLQFAGVQGFQRIYRILFLGERRGNCTVRAQAAYNFRAAYNELQTIAAGASFGPVFTDASYYSTTVDTSTDDGVFQLEINPKVQRCEALMLLVEDAFPSGGSEGFTFSHITAEIGLMPGAFRLRASRRTQ